MRSRVLASALLWCSLAAGALGFERCTGDWATTECPNYCTGFLVGKCCKYAGQKASMLAVPMAHNLAITARTEWYMNCTGADIQLTMYREPGFGVLFEINDAAIQDANGPGVFDSYMVQAMAAPAMEKEVEDLTPRIRDTPELNWLDLLSYVRKMGAYQDKQLSLPFDFDYLSVLLREDLREQYENATGRGEVKTWEDFADYVEYWNNTDLNDDGEPDVGICSMNGAGPAGPQAVLMAIAASKLQYNGYKTGFWFDTETMEPLFDNPGFKDALKVTRRLWLNSLDSQAGGWKYLHDDAWHHGKCAAYMWLTGSVAQALTRGQIVRKDENETILWEPTWADGTYREPRRTRLFGSSTVYDRTDMKMKKCAPNPPQGAEKDTHVLCPYMDADRDRLPNGDWVNRAPYYYSAYQHCSIVLRKNAPESKKEIIWDFAVFANIEATPVVAQDVGPTYLDPFRYSQFDASARQYYPSIWSDQMFADLGVEMKWAGSTENAGLPLSIPGQQDYEYSMEKALWQYFLDVGKDCIDKNDCKCRKYIGGKEQNEYCFYSWGGEQDLEMWYNARETGVGSLTVDETVAQLLSEWESITDRNGGREPQLDLYRGSIGLPPIQKFCAAGFEPKGGLTGGCEECPAGKFSKGGEDPCTPCAPGTYSEANASIECYPCEQGMYQEMTGATACADCPFPRMTTHVAGSDNLRRCGCDDAAFLSCRGDNARFPSCAVDEAIDIACDRCYAKLGLNRNATDLACDVACQQAGMTNSMSFCEVCPKGLDCSSFMKCREGVSTDGCRLLSNQLHGQPVAPKRYMMLEEKPYQAFECKSEDICPGGTPGTCQPSAAQNERSCAKCRDGFTMVDGSCVECDNSNEAILILVIIAAPFVAMMHYAVTNMGSEDGRRGRSKLWGKNTMAIFLSFVQVLAVMSSFNVKWPGPMGGALESSSIIIVDLTVFRAACHDIVGFHTRYLVLMAIPFLYVVSALFGGAVWSVIVKFKPGLPSMSIDTSVNTLGAMAVLIYVTLCNVVLSYFTCVPNPSAPDTLMDYRDVLCWSDDHLSLMAVAIIGLLIYVIGLIAFVSWLVFQTGRADPDSPWWARAKFIRKNFRPGCHHWVVILMLRNFGINLVRVAFAASSRLQLGAMITLLASFAVGQAADMPWRTVGNNYLAKFSYLMVIIIASLGFPFVNAEVEEFVEVFSLVVSFMATMGMVTATVGSGVYAVSTHMKDSADGAVDKELEFHGKRCEAVASFLAEMDPKALNLFFDSADDYNAKLLRSMEQVFSQAAVKRSVTMVGKEWDKFDAPEQEEALESNVVEAAAAEGAVPEQQQEVPCIEEKQSAQV